MARVVNEEEFALRRNEILNAAQGLIFTKGYEQMSIQDVIEILGISKGAFYHYFGSKMELLEALSERVEEEAFSHLTPIIQDEQLPALVVLERFFNATARWKTAQKGYLMALLRVWYHDDNAIVRQKMTASGFRRVMPLIAGVIVKGVEEGVLNTPYTVQIGDVLISLFLGMGDATARLLLQLDPQAGVEAREICYQRIVDSVMTYTHAIERVLGAAPGSVHFFDLELLREWVALPGYVPAVDPEVLEK